jgi:glycine/D-amino acid oxidase-like deaminating enzyme
MAMIRREFLQGVAGIAVAALPGVLHARRSRLAVGVVGGGIVGASIAYHLARAGVDVTVFEKNQPASGATGGSFAWVNGWSDDPVYQNLRMQGVHAWYQLDRQLPLNVNWGGLLEWRVGPEDVAKTADQIDYYKDKNYPMRLIGADEFAGISPHVNPGPFDTCLYAPLDGHVDPVYVTRTLLDQAAKHGARIIYPCEVTDFEMSGARLVSAITSKGNFPLDRIVVAGGTDTPALTSKVDFEPPMLHRPGVLAHSAPTDHLTNTIHYSPTCAFKQLRSGVLVMSEGGYAPETQIHAAIRSTRIDFPSDEIRKLHGNRILGKTAKMLPAARNTKLDRVTLAFRPVPEDGRPVVGFIPETPDVYVAVMHSGITLGPLMGQFVSREILDGVPVASLAPYRPDRYVAQKV